MVYGYARVSTKEQNEDRQLIAFERCGRKIDKVIIDKQSGKDFKRTGYQKMLKKLKNCGFYPTSRLPSFSDSCTQI